jgi:MFS family permease
MLCCYVLVFIGITLEVVSTTNEIFFAGKFIAGFPIGGFITICMTYIGEIVPLALRGIMTAAAALAFTLGPLIVSLVVNETGVREDRWAYRAIFVAQYGVSGIGLCIWPFLPESPWWLINKGRNEAAAKSLARLGYDRVEIEKRIAVISLTLEEVREETEGASFAECFRKSNLRRTIISMAPLSIQALCGVFFVAAYSTYYQQLAGYTAKESFTLGIVQQVLSMLGNITSWFLIDRVGRRNLTLGGMLVLTIVLCITGGLATINADGPIKGTVAMMLLYCYVYNVTIGATAYSLLTEVATSRLRAKTASMALALQNSLFVSTPTVTCARNNTNMETDHVGLRHPLPLQPRPGQPRRQGLVHLRRSGRTLDHLSVVLPARGRRPFVRGARRDVHEEGARAGVQDLRDRLADAGEERDEWKAVSGLWPGSVLVRGGCHFLPINASSLKSSECQVNHVCNHVLRLHQTQHHESHLSSFPCRHAPHQRGPLFVKISILR